MDLRLPSYIQNNPLLCGIVEDVNRRGFTEFASDKKKIQFTVKYFTAAMNSLMFEPETKDAEKSVEYREKGNEQFVSNMYSNLDKIIEMYTKSVAYAPRGTKELAMAYANRSAALFKARLFEDCLGDIQRALDSSLYPENLKGKLLVRRAKCLQALKKSDAEVNQAIADTSNWLSQVNSHDGVSGKKGIEDFLKNTTGGKVEKLFEKWTCDDFYPKLTNEFVRVPGISSALNLQHSEAFGRHYTATQDIKPGDILAVQKPYAKVVVPEMFYKLCWHCGKQVWSGLQCRTCIYAVFCNEECRDVAWREYHDLECRVLLCIKAEEVEHTCLMALRLTILGYKEAGDIELIKKKTKRIDATSDPVTKGFVREVLDPSKFSSICGLIKHPEKRSAYAQFGWSFLSIMMAYYLATETDVLGQELFPDFRVLLEEENFTFLAELIFRNMQIAGGNGHLVTSERGGQTINRYFSITPAFSLFNHSCYASAGLHDFKDKLVVYAVKSIKKGDQVFINYGYEFPSMSRTERQDKLKIEYCFTCKCIACENKWTTEDCRSYQKQDLPMVGRATAEEVLAEKDRITQTIFSSSLELEFTCRISKLVKFIELFSQHAQLPCKELMELEKLLHSAFRFYGNRYQALE